MKSFEDLIVWKKAHELTLKIYKLTSNFPKQELFGLVSQIRRASVSVESNIAEGFSRNTIKERKQFYCISRGSLEEVKCQLIIAKDLEFISYKEYLNLKELMEEVGKLLYYWINKS